MCACHGNLYAVMKEILKDEGLKFGGVRKPLPSVIPEDLPQIEECKKMIRETAGRL